MIKDAFNFCVLIAFCVILIIVAGFWWRLVSWLFCLGYGC